MISSINAVYFIGFPRASMRSKRSYCDNAALRATSHKPIDNKPWMSTDALKYEIVSPERYNHISPNCTITA